MLSKAYTKIYESANDRSHSGLARVTIAGLPEDNETAFEIEGSRVAGAVHAAVSVEYEIAPDVKSWGWNGINIFLLRPVVVKGTVTKTVTEAGKRPSITSKPFILTLDTSKLVVSYEASNIIAPKEVYISLGDNLEVDYVESYLTFHKPLGPS